MPGCDQPRICDAKRIVLRALVDDSWSFWTADSIVSERGPAEKRASSRLGSHGFAPGPCSDSRRERAWLACLQIFLQNPPRRGVMEDRRKDAGW
jgi:hypothetical protein